MKKKLALLLFVLFPFTAFSDYPEISALRETDFLFKQLVSDITASYISNSSGSAPLPLSLYRYTPENDETLFMVASRVNLPYESISSLNRLSSVREFSEKREILIPNQPLLFIPVKPHTDIEYLLSSRNYDPGNNTAVNLPGREGELFYYIIDGRFNNTERAFFLNTFFRFPTEKGRITSYFGYRMSPITGEHSFHPGIDIAAPAGTPVFAAGRGTVIANSWNDILGNYIIIRHPGTYQTVYGHLKKSFVVLDSTVNAGTVIGEVGSTGYSTGPHLHFEVRSGNRHEDPMNLLQRKQ